MTKKQATQKTAKVNKQTTEHQPASKQSMVNTSKHTRKDQETQQARTIDPTGKQDQTPTNRQTETNKCLKLSFQYRPVCFPLNDFETGDIEPDYSVSQVCVLMSNRDANPQQVYRAATGNDDFRLIFDSAACSFARWCFPGIVCWLASDRLVACCFPKTELALRGSRV